MILLLAGSLVISLTAGVPQPMCVYYGQACDGFGWPYQQDAEVILYANDSEIYRYTIDGSIEPGINFMLHAYLDDGSDKEQYARNTVLKSDIVTIKIRDHYGLKTLVETNAIPSAIVPGGLYRVRITAGSDSDADGLSDQWEWEMIDWLNDPSIVTLADINPDDDSDGDGASNRDEYDAGTFAFLDYDYFAIRAMTPMPSRRMRIIIPTVPGKTYSVEETANLVQPSWETMSFALDDVAGVSHTRVEGDGGWMSLYVTVTNSTLSYFRMVVE